MIEEEDRFIKSSRAYQDLERRHNELMKGLIGLYTIILDDNHIRKLSVQSSKVDQQAQYLDQFDEHELQMRPLILVESLKELYNIIFEASYETCQQLSARINSLDGAYDEVQLRLEDEIRKLMINNEKMRIKNEILQKKLSLAQNNELKLEQQLDQMKLSVRRVKNEFESQLKQKEQEVQIVKKNNLTTKSSNMQRKASQEEVPKFQKSNKISHIQTQELFNSSSVEMAVSKPLRPMTTVSKEQFQALTKSLSKLHAEPKKDDHQFQSKLMSVNQQKNMEQQKFTYQINKLEYQIEQKDKEILKLKRNMEDIHLELQKIKQKQAEDEKRQWELEAVSEKNPHLLDYYKQKLEAMTKEVKMLLKSQRKFAIMEKKLLVKEKAFEFERADYHDQILNLNTRVNALVRIHEQSKQPASQHRIQPHYHQQEDDQ